MESCRSDEGNLGYVGYKELGEDEVVREGTVLT